MPLRPIDQDFPLWVGRGDPPLTEKLACTPSPPPPLFCHKNIDFVIFMQFLAILPKWSHPQVKNWEAYVLISVHFGGH